MALNIKNPRTEELIHELAELTGESFITAIAESVRERLERIRQQRGTGLSARLLDIGRDCAARLKAPYRSIEPGELLYDERGLPR